MFTLSFPKNSLSVQPQFRYQHSKTKAKTKQKYNQVHAPSFIADVERLYMKTNPERTLSLFELSLLGISSLNLSSVKRA